MTKPKVFQLIDLDRTLFDTSKFVKALTDNLDTAHPEVGRELNRRFEAAYKNDETFFLLRYLRKEHGDQWFDELVQKVVAKHGAMAFAMPGISERIVLADMLGGWGILTYGDTVDQELKRRLIGLEHAPMYVLNTPDKSAVIAQWKLPDGRFQLPKVFGGEVVDIVTLEDDKHRAFTDLPDNTVGVWITPTQSQNAFGHAPGTLLRAKNLSESTELLKKYFN